MLPSAIWPKAVNEKKTSSKPLKRRLLGWGLEILLLICVIFLLHLWQTRDTATGQAPPLTGQTLTGEMFDLTNLQGRSVLVHFWATWCPVCRLESGTIDSLAGDYPLITIAMQSGSEAVIRQYLAENELSFPVISDPDGRLASHWGVRGVPATFIIDAQGNIRFVEVGYTTGPGLRARLWWLTLGI